MTSQTVLIPKHIPFVHPLRVLDRHIHLGTAMPTKRHKLRLAVRRRIMLLKPLVAKPPAHTRFATHGRTQHQQMPIDTSHHRLVNGSLAGRAADRVRKEGVFAPLSWPIDRCAERDGDVCDYAGVPPILPFGTSRDKSVTLHVIFKTVSRPEQ
jgi:hypothetical protein